MAFVDDEEVIEAPAKVLEAHVPTYALVAREIGVIEYGVVEGIVSKRVAVIVVLGPKGPVVMQALRAQHKNPVVAFLVALDDGEGLVGLAQANRIRDNVVLVLP